MSDNGASIPPQTFVECGECSGNTNVSWFCKNCPVSLCDTCARNHKTKRPYKTHAVVSRTYNVLRLYGPAKIAEQCKIHPEKDISTYCNDCDVPCCVSCLTKDHKRHDFSTIEDKYLDTEKRLNEYYRKLDTDVRPTLDKMEEEARTDVKEENTYADKVISDINDFRNDINQNFNRACDDLISQVKKSQGKGKETLEDIEACKKNLVSLKREIEERIECGNLDIMKYVPPKIESLIPKSKITQNMVPSFEPAKKILDVINESVGRIHLKEIKKKDKDRCKDMGSLNVKKKNSFKSKIGAISITNAGNGNAWIMHYENTTMYLYNHKGEEVKIVTVKGSKGINDMAITSSGEIIVTCEDKKVRRVSANGKVSVLIDTALYVCEGVCLTDKEEIIVCMRGQGDKNHVAVYSPDGSSKIRQHRVTDPYRVVQNDQDLCVVNTSKNVVCVDEKGNMRWMYEGREAKVSHRFNPRCICVDQHHNLLVTDCNNYYVHYLDKEGILIQIILTKEPMGLICHWGICVDDETGYVWVGSLSGYVVVAKYLE